MAFTVGYVAKLAKVSVRTLHHYDEIGLLTPTERSDSGYRLYSQTDLERLQEILFYKELGFSLDEIRDLLKGPGYDRQTALRTQRDLIEQKLMRHQAMLTLIDKTLRSLEGEIRMTHEEMFEVFGFDHARYQDEVKERWGATDAYKESTRRAGKYTKDDWIRFRQESEEINAAIIALIDEGVAPTDPRAMDAVEQARLQIDQWFYPCSREMHAMLGQMYVSDPRFTETYEKMRPGMAQWMCDATAANASRTSE